MSDEEELKKEDDDDENDDWRKFFEDEPVASEDGKTKSGHQMAVH